MKKFIDNQGNYIFLGKTEDIKATYKSISRASVKGNRTNLWPLFSEGRFSARKATYCLVFDCTDLNVTIMSPEIFAEMLIDGDLTETEEVFI